MSEDNVYQDAEIVWVKLRSCWWPGEVCSQQRQPEGLLKHSKRKPYCVVKFFQEESFEYVKNSKMIFPFNCSKKDEFIRKGHALLAKNKYMEQFPAAVSTAERLTRSVTRSSLFFNSRPDSIIKAILTDSPPQSESIRNGRQCEIVDKILQTKPTGATNTNQSPELSPTYKCSICDFKSTRQNVMVLHRRSHSASGATPHRNSHVSRSIISPSNTKELQKSPEIIKEDDKVIGQTPVSKEIELPHRVEYSGVTEIKSDLINTVFNNNLPKEPTSNENRNSTSAIFIRPPPKKQLNFINCKSENIQKSLLADWIDEEKEDDDEREDEDSNSKQVKAVEILTIVNKSNQYSSSSFASTSASAEKFRNESVDQINSVALIEPNKPTCKIRNIPKKDRRNIVFTDFNQSEEFSHIHSQSQKPMINVSSHIHFNEQNNSSVPESSVEIPLVTSVNAELVIQPLKTNTNTEEISISKIFARGLRDKSKLTEEDRNIHKGKIPARKSTRHEAKNLKAFVEEIPADSLTFFQSDLNALYEDTRTLDNNNVEVTGVDASLTVTPREASVEKYFMKNTDMFETVTGNTASVKSDTLKLSTNKLLDNLPAVKSTAIVVQSFTAELGIEEPTTSDETGEEALDERTALKQTTVEPKAVSSVKLDQILDKPSKDLTYSIEQSTTEKSTAELISVEQTPMELTEEEPRTGEPITLESITLESITLESITLESITVEPATKEPTTEEPTTIEPKTLEPTTAESTAREPPTIKRLAIQHRTIESTTIEPITVEPKTVEPTIVEPTTVEPTTVEPTTVEPTTVKPTTVEPTTVEPTTVEPTTVEPITVQPTTVELTTVEPTTVEPTLVEPTTAKPTTVEPTTVELTKEEPTTVQYTTVKPTTVEPIILEPKTVEPIIVEPTTMEPMVVELITVEPTTVEPKTVEPITVDPTTVEPLTEEVIEGNLTSIESTTVDVTSLQSNAEEPITEEPITIEETSKARTSVELCTEEPTTIEPISLKLSSMLPNSVEPARVEKCSDEPSTLEPATVELPTVELPTVELPTVELPTTLKPTSKDLNPTKPIKGDITVVQPTKIKLNKIEPTIKDVINNEIDQTKVLPIAVETSGVEIGVTEIKTYGLKSSEQNTKVSEQTISYHKALEPVSDDFLTNDLSLVPRISVESPSAETFSVKLSAEGQTINSTTNEQSTVALAVLKHEATKVQENQTESITEIFSTFTIGLSTQEFSSAEKHFSSQEQLKMITSNSEIKFVTEDDQIKLSHVEDKSDDTKFEDKYYSVAPNVIKSYDEVPKVKTATKSKNSADMKKLSKEKKPALRSSAPRGCKRDISETKETFAKKRMTKTSSKKIKLNDRNTSNEKQTIVSSFDTESLTNDQAFLIQGKEDKQYCSIKKSTEEKSEDKVNTNKSAEEETSVQTLRSDKTACSLTISNPESEVLSHMRPDESTRIAEECTSEPRTSYKSDEKSNPQPDIINSEQSTEPKPHVPVYLELEGANPVTDLNASKPRSSFSKASLACFDFNEEEDILTSIANFKKTYVSPEKSYNFCFDSRTKTPDAQKLELEMKDKQLSADIESLLKTTTLPVNLASTSTASVSNRPFSNEVRRLPIKERGKRIFKSRNRFRIESCHSVSTTSATEIQNVSFNQIEVSNRVVQTHGIKKEDSAKESHVEDNVDAMKKLEEKTMDDKVTNSEEEIIERIVFSPGEVYAPLNEEVLTKSVQIRESLVSSSGMEVNTKSMIIRDKSVDHYIKKEDIISGVCNAQEMNFKSPSFSCKIRDEDEPNHNLLPSYIEQIGDENEMCAKDVLKPECNSINDSVSENDNQNEAESSNNDLEQEDGQENKSSTFDSSFTYEENPLKIQVQQAKVMEDVDNIYAEEKNYPIYDKEMSVDEETGKTNDSNCESPFEYELVTTEVSTIVDHISNEEQNVEHVKESSTEVSEEVVSCCDDGTFLNEMIIADVTESQSSVTENEIENSNVTLKYVEAESGVIENPTDESNSCSINGINTKIYAIEENDNQESNVPDEKLKAEVEHAETSSDDSSTMISDAEAEFGSPTSMLEEERVLNRSILGNETSVTSAEGKGQRTLKKSTQKIRYQLQNSPIENKLIIQSLQCDTQESTSNDIVNELVYDANKFGSDLKECLIEPKLLNVRKKSFSNKPLEKEVIENVTESQENIELVGKHIEAPDNEKRIADSNYENSESSSEEEEEICSPPIEPLLDEDTEAETIENYSTTNSLSKSDGEQQVDCEVTIASDIVPEFQLDHSEKSKMKDKVSQEHYSENTNTSKDESSADVNGKQSDSYYTITQKSDTIIKLNKHKEKSKHEMVAKAWTETSVDVRKSELAGEELSAAEALLLIPNQTTNMLENSTDLINKPVESADPIVEGKNPRDLLNEEEIKEEILEYSDSVPRQELELGVKADIPKELVRRKRRSHMKVTPRKRIINVAKPEEKIEESPNEAKFARLTNTSKDSCSKLIKSSENVEQHRKSFTEQYEENFVLKYMKEQFIEEMDAVEPSKDNTEGADQLVNLAEKQSLEKVHISVDISNPLSSQIATILGTNRPTSTDVPLRSGVKKRKQSVEDDIPSFIIKRPCPKTIADEEAADRETIAQIQNLCPQVEITRKSSKDDQNALALTPQQDTSKPQIINQQILRAGNNQPLITVTAKGKKPEEGIFDISSMPIVLSNEKIVNEKLHLVITPTTNPQLIKQFQNQHQLLSSTGTSVSNFTGNTTTNLPKPGIPVRRTSCVRTKRTPSRQQMPEQQQISETQNFEQDNFQQHQLQEYADPHQQLQEHQQQVQQEHSQFDQQRQNHQGQVQLQNQFQQQLQPQQFQHQHQNQIQQQLQDEQNILFQQHHQLLLQQQLQLQQQQLQQQQLQQQQLQSQHQLVANEKASQSNISEKQIGIDNRGNKYVIIRNPSNTVVLANSPEPCKVTQQRASVTTESCDQSSQRKQRQKKQSPLTVQTGTPANSPLPAIVPLPVTSPPPHILSITSTQANQPQQYFKDQHIVSPSIPVTLAATAKPKGRGRGRPPKNKTETVQSTKQSTSNNVKINANGRRSTGRICEPPRQRSTRLLAVTSSSEAHQPTMAAATVYATSQQQTPSVGFMINPQFTTMPAGSSPNIRANNETYQSQALVLSPQSRTPTAPEIPIETSEVSGGGYAVPSLPVPGYPQTYLLCELIGNKYKEVFSKPLYLSPDRTRFLEVPDELVTEDHTKLSDSRREPNPNALKLVSDGTPHILQSRLIEINSENMVNQNEGNGQQNEVLMQKQQQLSVEEQASALLCLQEQLTQEHLVQKQISQERLVQERLAQEQLVQDQLVQEQLVQEQFVEEQFVQEQFVQEQFVQEQYVQEQFVQEQFVQEQFVQEQFVQEQFVPEQFVQEQFNLQPQQFSLQLARFETGEVIEDAERGQMMVVTTGTHNMILDDKSFFEFTGEKKIDFYNAEKDTYVLTPQVISSLLHHYALGHITAVPALNTEIADQQEVSIADVIQNADSSTNILEVALDESGLYSEEQFINTGEILQIETPDGMQLIGTAAENADLIFHHMTKANTNETNVLLNQAPKMSAVEIPSDKSKRRFETKPSTPATLEDCLNVIGVPIQSPNVPSSLELPASVTNPAIVAKTRTPTPGTITMNEIIATGLCHHPDITSLPSMTSNDQELSYEFFPSNTEAHEAKDQVNEESVVTDMGEYAVVTSSASFDDPGR